jgi:ribonuclease BN (tRNA processing enzyme)
MIKIVFLGVGEACDENLPNTSILVEAKKSLLLDCGYSVVNRLWQYNSNPEFPDGVYISHLHGDHFMGLPFLLLRAWEVKRKNPLTIICHPSMKNALLTSMKTAYWNIYEEFNYKFLEIRKNIRFHEFELEIAKSGHAQTNYAIKVNVKGRKIGYSGDGDLSNATAQLFRDCDVLIHEAYFLEKGPPSHGSAKGLIEYVRRAGIKKLALVHICRHKVNEVKKFAKQHKNILTPRPFDKVILA